MKRTLMTSLALAVALAAFAGCAKNDKTQADNKAKAVAPAPAAKAGDKGATTAKAGDTKAAAAKAGGTKAATAKAAAKPATAKPATAKPGAAPAAKPAGDPKDCQTLMDKLCKDLGEKTKTCAMVRAKTPQFPAQRCTMMLGQYDKVLAELKSMEKMNQPLEAALVKKQSEGDVASFGPKDAKVVVVEYSDFQCPYCSRAAKTVEQLRKDYGDKIRFVFHQFPLSFHKNAHNAATAAFEAKAQGKFWELHDLMFANQRALERPKLEEYAKQVGMDVAKLKKALDGDTYKAAIDADIALGKEVGVRGTPTMFINAERVQNPADYNMVKKEIDAQLAK